jgi:SAM-dependent methyltransferase
VSYVFFAVKSLFLMEHFFHKIPGWFSFRSLYEQAVREARDGAHFVEVGCWKGRSAAFMAVEIINSGKKIRFDCVDTWLGSNEPKHLADESVRKGTLCEEFLRNITPVIKAIGVLRAPSALASALYDIESLDFVFIDAAHDYENVLSDIRNWWTTIRPGGVLAGDDFTFRGVNKAVTEYFGKNAEAVKGTGNGMQWLVRKPSP